LFDVADRSIVIQNLIRSVEATGMRLDWAM